MRKLALAPLLLLALTGCHRLTGLEGRAGAARHGNGFHVLSQITLWLAVFSIIAGVSFLVHGLVAQRGESDPILWGSTLTLVGFVLLVGTYLSALGLMLCHGTC